MGQQVSSAQDKFPFKPIREIQSSPRGVGDFRWSLWDGQDVKDGTKLVSIFCLEPSTHPLAVAMNKRFRSFRHPNILPFNHGITVDEENKTYIVTERVEPLLNKLDEVLQLPDSIPWGIHQITKAVHWLNKDFNLVHGNINLSSVYVTKQGDWKLGGLDLISSIQDVKEGNALLFKYRDLSTNIQWSPEMQAPLEKSLPALKESANSAIDAWLLGCLIWSLYHGDRSTSSAGFDRNRLKDMSKIPDSLKEDYAKLLTGSPRNRLMLDRLLDSSYFDTTFVQTCLFIESLMLKDAFEKEKFFKGLPKVLQQFPDAMSKYKILPSLTTGLDYGSADHHALPVILTIAAKLSPDEYKAQITPSVLKWFAAPDRTLRLGLLTHLESIIVHLDSTQVSNVIWAPLSQGFTDPVPQLRELTVKSLIHFAPKLNEKIINGDLLKFLAALQVDQIPGIRCNTTICLGKIARQLTPTVRHKVLLQAFCRALKDPFAPSRKAALTALAHCHDQSFFTPTDVASKLIPAVAPMTLDPERSVRQAAITGLTAYLHTLQTHSDTLPESLAVPSDGSGPTTAPQDTSSSTLSASSSNMLDWALGKVLGSDTKENKSSPAPTAPHATTTQAPASHAKTPSFTQSNRPVSSSSNPANAHSISSTHSSSSSLSSTSSRNQTHSNQPGEVPWGDDDDTEPEHTARPCNLPNLRSNTSTTSHAPKTSSTFQPAPSSAFKVPSNGWDDDSNEDDGWSSNQPSFSSSRATTTSSQTSHRPNHSTYSANTQTKSTSGMSLTNSKKTPSVSQLSAWGTDDPSDGGSGWGDDFDAPSPALSRVPKSASSSRFG